MSDFVILCLQPNALGGVRRETYDGREWLVVPVVAQVEGVVNGELVTLDELSKFPGAWEGIPIITGDHPYKQGMAVSARTQDQALRSPGQLFNTDVDTKGKLKGEIWLDIDKANKLGGDAKRAVAVFENGGRSQVSTAYFRDMEKKTGVYKGKHYESVAHNIRPDHLAILFDKTGACNWAEGCGAPRINAESLERTQRAVEDAWMAHYNENPTITPEKQRSYVIETYDDHLIARVGPSYYKVPFDRADDGTVTFGARRVWEKVKEKREWIAVNILAKSRRPSYDGVETSAWGNVNKSFDSYRDGYYTHTGAARPGDPVTNVGAAPQAMKTWIASKSLLGDAKAATFADLLFFPVVNPNTNHLNRGALVAVTGGRGAQAKIPGEAKSSAQSMASNLLKSKFKVKGNTLVILSALQAIGLEQLWPYRAKEDVMDRDQMIQTLLACNHCQFTQEQLDAMEDDSLQHLSSMATQIATLTANAERTDDQDPDPAADTDQAGDRDGAAANADQDGDQDPAANADQSPVVPPELGALAEMVKRLGGVERLEAMITSNAAQETAERGEIVARLKTNALCAFSEDELNVLPLATLRKLDASLAPASYGGRFRPPASASRSPTSAPEMTSILLAKPKQKSA